LTLDIYVDKIFSKIEICTGTSTEISSWSLDLPMMDICLGLRKIQCVEQTALGKLRPKYFVEDRLKFTDGNSYALCSNEQ